MTQECENCAAAVAGAAAAKAIIEAVEWVNLHCPWCGRSYGRSGHAPGCARQAFLANPSPAVAALERLQAQLEQAHDELDAVDEALGEFYMPVLDDDDVPCGASYKDHGVNVMRQELERLRALAALVPDANFWFRMVVNLDGLLKLSQGKEGYDFSRSWMTKDRALAARIEAAREEQAQEDGGGD